MLSSRKEVLEQFAGLLLDSQSDLHAAVQELGNWVKHIISFFSGRGGIKAPFTKSSSFKPLEVMAGVPNLMPPGLSPLVSP